MKKKIGNIFDGILIALFVGLSIYFVVEAFIGGLIPIKYILIAMSFLLLLAILILLTFKSQKIVWNVIRKISLTLLCVVLVAGALLQGQIRSAFGNVDDGNTSKDQMFIVALKESKVNSIEDVTVLSYLDHTDALTLYALKELDSYSFEKESYEDLNDQLNALDEKEVDAVLISAQNQTHLQKLEDSKYNEKYKVIYTIEKEITQEKPVNDVDITTKPFVVYVSGLDDMGEPTYNGLSDVNMLLMVDPVHHHVEMVSINRDTYVPNEKFGSAPDKLTHLGWDGPEASAATLERIFGIEVDYTARVTFESLIKIIDTLGGIDVDVKISFTEQDENRSFAEGDLIHLEAGYQHLNGREALAYARHRKTANWDVAGREQAQRQIVEAVVNKILSVEGALKIGDVLNVAASYVSTNLPMDKAKAFVMHAIDEATPWTFGSSTVDSGYEYLFPCVSFTGMDLYAVLLSESDLQHIHNLYTSMNTETKLNEFEFDLNNMEQYEDKFQVDKYVITIENYNTTVPTYFPDYYRAY